MSIKSRDSLRGNSLWRSFVGHGRPDRARTSGPGARRLLESAGDWLDNAMPVRAVRAVIRERKPSSRRRIMLPWEGLEARLTLSAAPSMAYPIAIVDPLSTPSSSPNGQGFTPEQIRTAYGIDAISFGATPADGTGQTIAIVDEGNDPAVLSDLDTFDQATYLTPAHTETLYKQYGPAASFLTVYNQTGQNITQYIGTSGTNGVPTNSTDIAEIALDVEWAHAAAPGAKIDLVLANSYSSADIAPAEKTAANPNLLPGVSVVSMSYGFEESSGESAGDGTFAAPGITFLASSGDSGWPGAYPAYSPYVIAVGGTTLTLNFNDGAPVDSIQSELAWSTQARQGSTMYQPGSGSGGGTSQYEPEPPYQMDVQSTGKRTIPDVALDANPDTGCAVVDSPDYGAGTPWNSIGGTSLACPIWAGLMAIVNQGRVLAGEPTLNSTAINGAPQAEQALSLLYTLPSSDFNDITVGLNITTVANSGIYRNNPILDGQTNGFYAMPGYDEVTGLGSPIANLPVPQMIGSTVSPLPQPSRLVVTTLSDAIGHTGTSLRDAVNAANYDAEAGYSVAITFSVSGTIALQQGPLELNQALLQQGPGTGSITINGGGQIAVSAGFSSTVFQVDPGVNATFNGLTIEEGKGAQGGGIDNNGTLAISNCTLSVNYAVTANSISGQGGGIYNGGTLTVSDSTLTGNWAYGSATATGGAAGSNSYTFNVAQGGGIYNSSSGFLTVSASTLNGNIADGSATFTNGLAGAPGDTFNAGEGGGIYNLGAATVSNSTVFGNQAYGVATNLGGFPYLGTAGTYNEGDGGGIWNAGNLTVSQGTVNGNYCTSNSSNSSPGATLTLSFGGGIFSYTGLTLLNSIVAGDFVSYNSAPYSEYDVYGALSNLSSGDVINQSSGSFLASSLASNGGPTQTVQLTQGYFSATPLTTVTSDPGYGPITVANAAAIASSPGDYFIQVGSEQMLVTNVNLATNTLTVVRGYNFTTVAVHAPGSAVYLCLDQRGDARATPTFPSVGAYQYGAAAPGTPSITGVVDDTFYGTQSGPFTGGTAVYLTGTNLGNVTSVNFGSLPARILGESSNYIIVLTPFEPIGTVNVTVTTAAGLTSAPAPQQYTFAAPTSITVTPAATTQAPIAVTGFNQDVIWADSEGSTASVGTSSAFDVPNNWVLFENGAGEQSPGGLPVSGSFTSASNPAVNFQLASYTGPNVLMLGSAAGQPNSGTLALATPGSFTSLNILDSAANGGANFNFTLNFSDGSSLTQMGEYAPNWFYNTPYALGGIGRVNRGNSRWMATRSVPKTRVCTKLTTTCRRATRPRFWTRSRLFIRGHSPTVMPSAYSRSAEIPRARSPRWAGRGSSRPWAILPMA